MLRSNVVRFLLTAILLIGVVSIVISIRSRTDRIEPAQQPAELLPPEISRHSTGFEFSQLKEGRVVFKVFAKTSTMTQGGEHQLEEVRLVGLDEEGAVRDRVEARGALYRINDRQIEFRKDVRIFLADGTEIRADRAAADLGTEVVTIRDAFRFIHGEFEGAGRGLSYRVSSRRLDVGGGLDLSFPAGNQPGRAEAGSARYDMLHGRLALRSGVRIGSGVKRLSAEEILFVLTPQHRIESVHASGEAALRLSEEEELMGDRVWIGFPTEDGEPGRLISTAGEVDGAETRARFVRTSPTGRQSIEGNRIVVPFRVHQEGGDDGVTLEELSTSGDVLIRSGNPAFDRGTADRSRTEFDSATGEPTRMILSGEVRLQGLFGALTPDPSELQTLSCTRLDVRMQGATLIESMEAEGPLELVSNDRKAKRRLRADERLTLAYRDGQPSRLTARGACELTGVEGSDSSRLTAPLMELELADRKPQRATASGGVRLEALQNGDTIRSASDELVVHYAEGIAREVEQSGSFTLNRRGTGGDTLSLSGDHARYETATGMLQVQAQKRPRLEVTSQTGSLKTEARVIHLDRIREEVLAEGEVETTIDTAGRPSVVTAGEMRASLAAGRMEFSGNRPRLVQGSNLIRADELQIESEPGILRATGNVDSVWMDESGEQPKEFRVRAQRLDLESPAHHAVYQEDVRLDSEELQLQAPRLELFFLAPPESGLERLEGSGGVEIVERGRHWRAEHATYLRKTDQVVATK